MDKLWIRDSMKLHHAMLSMFTQLYITASRACIKILLLDITE